MLEDKAVIEELIAYNREGNFDVAMALMGAIIQINEHYNEDFLEEYKYDNESISDFLADLYVNKYGSAYDRYDRKMKKDKRQNNGRINEVLDDF